MCGQASPIGMVEQHMVHGEGECFALVTMYFPASVKDMMTPRAAMPAVVWYRSRTETPNSPTAAAFELAAKGYIVVFVELCGFGSVGE